MYSESTSILCITGTLTMFMVGGAVCKQRSRRQIVLQPIRRSLRDAGRPGIRLFVLACLLFLTGALFAQRAQKPLTNADVVKMVHGKLPESVIVSSIRTNGGKFDTSPDALIALQKAGVTPGELDAIVAASGAPTPPQSSVAPASDPAPPPPPEEKKSTQPVVAYVEGNASQDLAMEKTSLAETKTKPTSLKSLSGDSVLAQSMQAGVNTAATDLAIHTSSMVGSSAVQQAGSIFSSMIAQRKPTITYVWGVPGPSSTNIVPVDTPAFSVDFSNARHANPDDFEPVMLRLTPAQNSCRIVGATQGKTDAAGSPAADWEIYSHFVEDRVALKTQKLGPGRYRIVPVEELDPGEYAVALRPVSKSKRFSGGQIARGQGEGLLFDAVWTFQVPEQK